MTEASIGTGFNHVHGPDVKPSEAVIATVADMTDQSPLEMTPLIRIIDTDTLNRLFDTTNGNDTCLTVAFEYSGCHITVSSDEVQAELING